MDYQSGLCFIIFLIVVFGIPDSIQFYSVDLEAHSFDDAQKLCEPDGSLANMPNQAETLKILKVIEDKRDRNSTSYWIGLKKEKTKCVQEHLPLKGFYWTIDNNNSTKFDLIKWKEEPSHTCTSALCGLLSVEYEDSKLVSWGLAAKACSKKFPFICKHEGSNKNYACATPPVIFGGHDITQKESDPYTLWVSCNGTDTFTLTCLKSTGKWKLVGGTNIQELCLKCKNGYKKDKDRNCVDVVECKQSNICKFMCINREGSYRCMCVDGMQNFHVEDSEICKKAKISYPIPVTDATKEVQDKPNSSSIDKKSPPSSQPAIDSTTKSGVLIEESTGDLSNIVIPLIIALLIFVVLVVIVVAIVKYCHMRRARKRAMKRAAALKESVALNGSDSMEKVNE